jgi:hypothetical protein
VTRHFCTKGWMGKGLGDGCRSECQWKMFTIDTLTPRPTNSQYRKNSFYAEVSANQLVRLPRPRSVGCQPRYYQDIVLLTGCGLESKHFEFDRLHLGVKAKYNLIIVRLPGKYIECANHRYKIISYFSEWLSDSGRRELH